MTLAFALIRDLEAIEMACYVFMQGYALYEAHKAGDVAWQGCQRRRMLIRGRCQCACAGIIG
jgi:hypothetical protein